MGKLGRSAALAAIAIAICAVAGELTASALSAAGSPAASARPSAIATRSPLPTLLPTPSSTPTPHWLSSGAAGIFPDPTPTVTPTPRPDPNVDSPGQRAFKQTRDGSYLEPTSWSVTIYKKKHQLIVYYKGRLYRTYHAVFGRSFEPGTKLWEGDRRTPEGVYTIIEKHYSRRWQIFLTLNYPNVIDRDRYLKLRGEGEVPFEDGRAIGVGGRIGIHGTDNPVLNADDINWTTGCISVDNKDIFALDSLLPVGTVVIIKP
ncbi:MAG TPA: L,D-transpeptidase [Candidatus Binataceae bacterium]